LKEWEVDEIIVDIKEAFQELGTVDNANNIIWRRRLPNEPDFAYYREKNLERLYTNYEMTVLSIGEPSREELLNEGLDDRGIQKMYIDGSQFTQYEDDTLTKFRPDYSDAIIYKGIQYEVSKIRPIRISDKAIVYIVFMIESEVFNQTEEYREEKDPYFEIDMSQEVQSTNDTGANDNLLVDYGVVLETGGPPYFITSTSNMLYFKTEPEGDVIELELPLGTHVPDTLVNEFDIEGITVELGDGNLIIKTDILGKDAYLELVIGDNSAYTTLGLEVGIYEGYVKMRGYENG
jgi:hypothetical protein